MGVHLLSVARPSLYAIHRGAKKGGLPPRFDFFFPSFTHLFPRTRCWRMAAACFNWTVFVNCRLYLKNRRPRRYAGYTGTVNASRKTIPKGKTPYPEYDDDMAELASYVALTHRTNPPESTRRGPTVSCCCVVGRLAFACAHLRARN